MTAKTVKTLVNVLKEYTVDISKISVEQYNDPQNITAIINRKQKMFEDALSSIRALVAECVPGKCGDKSEYSLGWSRCLDIIQENLALRGLGGGK